MSTNEPEIGVNDSENVEVEGETGGNNASESVLNELGTVETEVELSAFKNLVAKDRINVYLSLDDFGETHSVAGKEIVCVIDNDVHNQRAPEVGVESGDMRLFASTDDVERREAGDVLEIDGALYAVVSWQEDLGMAEIVLSASRAAY